MRPKFVQAKTTTLDVGISLTETNEIILKNLVDLYGNQLDMADIGATLVLTFNPGGSSEEIIACTDFTVASDGKVTLDTGIMRGLLGVTPYTSGGTAYDHSAGTVVVVSNQPQIYEAILNYIDAVAVAGGANATETSVGFVELATQAEIDADTATGSAGPLAVTPQRLASSKYGQRLPSAPAKVFLDSVTGMLVPFAGSAAPTGFLLCDGTAYDNDTYPALALVLLGKFGYGTGVDFTADNTNDTFTKTSHGLTNGEIVFVRSQTTLPAGLSANTPYYVRDAATNTFKLSTSAGGAAVDITTNGTGTHYFYTSFKVPDMRGSVPIGQGTKSIVLSIPEASVTPGALVGSVASSSIAGNTVTFAGVHGLTTGNTVVFTGTVPTGLATNTNYYVRVISGTEISLHSSFFNAVNNVSPADITSNTAGAQAYKGMTFTSSQLISELLQTGQAVVLATSGTLPAGMTAGTYYFIRLSDTTFQLASSHINAKTNTALAFLSAADDGTGTHTLTFTLTARSHGTEGGEENHQLLITELASHFHASDLLTSNASGGGGSAFIPGNDILDGIPTAGGDVPHNNMQPFVVLNWIIKS